MINCPDPLPGAYCGNNRVVPIVGSVDLLLVLYLEEISKAMLYNGGIIVVIEGIRYGSIKCTFLKT